MIASIGFATSLSVPSSVGWELIADEEKAAVKAWAIPRLENIRNSVPPVVVGYPATFNLSSASSSRRVYVCNGNLEKVLPCPFDDWNFDVKSYLSWQELDGGILPGVVMPSYTVPTVETFKTITSWAGLDLTAFPEDPSDLDAFDVPTVEQGNACAVTVYDGEHMAGNLVRNSFSTPTYKLQIGSYIQYVLKGSWTAPFTLTWSNGTWTRTAITTLNIKTSGTFYGGI